MSDATRTNGAALKRIGKALTALRENRGVSQNELASLSGVAQNTISRMEAGKSYELINLLACLTVLDKQAGDFLVDAGFTSEREAYNEYTFKITVLGKRIKNIRGDVSGPGLRRATE